MSIIISIFILGVLVFVHELGHFVAGLAVGIKAETFSIGFGPAIIKKTIKGVKFQIACLPLGGYCKFQGESPADGELAKDDFINMSPIKRIIVYFAGPFCNYLFAVALLLVLVSMPMSRSLYSPTAYVFTDGRYLHKQSGMTLAYEYGFRSGDTITHVNQNKVETDFDVLSYIHNIKMLTNEENVSFSILRDGKTETITIPSNELLKAINMERELGLYFGAGLKIKNIVADSAAFEAGILAGDEIIAINNQTVHSIADFRPLIMDNPMNKVSITLIRNGEQVVREAIPTQTTANGITFGSLGVEFINEPVKVESVPGAKFPASIGKAFSESKNYLVTYINGMKLLFTGKLSLKDNLGGPVKIIQITSQVVSNSGEQRMLAILSFTATISLILFFMNLLPLPVVDGGMILMAIIEVIIRRPINRAVLSKIQTVGAFLLITLAVFITVNDITQLFK